MGEPGEPRYTGSVPREPTVAAPPRPWRELGRERLVHVHEYHCTACAGDPPQDERFAHPSIAIVRSGVFGIRTERQPQLMTTGFVLLGNPGQHYEATHEHGGGDRCLVFEFRGGALEALAAEARRSAHDRPPFARNVLPPLPRATALQQLAVERLAPGTPAQELGLDEIGVLLAEIALEHAGKGHARPAAREPHATRVRDQVFAAIAAIVRASDEPLSLDALAREAGLSPFHFLRQFKREVGVTPHRYLVQARLRKAIALLRDSSRPVTQIAFDVGFGDLSNFMHAFRSELGRSPGQFRKRGLS